jgi:hypothetical protein
MVRLGQVIDLVNARKSRVLLIAEASLPECQFRAFRKLFLHEFGDKGLDRELMEIFNEDRAGGKLDRNGRE